MFLRLNVSCLMHLKINCLASSAMERLVHTMTASLESADCEERFTSETVMLNHVVIYRTRVLQQINYCMTAEPKMQLLCITSQTVPGSACRASYASCTGHNAILQLEAVLELLHDQLVSAGS